MYYWFTNPEADLDVSSMGDLASKIKKIKSGMEVDLSTVDFSDVRSIPDVWYIHRIFEMMLLHPIDGEVMTKYRDAVLRHWYSIIAIYFIGKKKFGLNIKSTSINSESMDKITARPEVIVQATSIISSTWESRPKRRICMHPYYDTEEMKIFYVEDAKGERYPIAMSSPTTFIVPTADAWKNLYKVCPDIPWIRKVSDDTYLVDDPCAVPGALTMDERNALAKNLDQLARDTKNNSAPNEMHAAITLASLLTTYTTDAAGLASAPQDADIFPEKFKLHYVEIEDTMPPSADNPTIGGISPMCVCSHTLGKDGQYKNYIVPLPLSQQAIEWLLDGRASYQMEVVPTANRPQFNATYVYGNQTYKKNFSDVAANVVPITKKSYLNVSLLWPRFKMDNWDYYYTYEYQQDPARESYSIVPVDNIESEASFDIGGNKTVHYTKLNKWPKIWGFVRRNMKGTEDENKGYLLTREISCPTQSVGKELEASIDFGTSSTIMYSRVDDLLKPITGENIWSLPMFSDSKAQDRKQSVYGFFIPPIHSACTLAPMQSILAIEKDNNASPLLGNWTYFRQVTEENTHSGLPSAFATYADLKWNPIKGKMYTTSFLNIISQYVALEARVHGCSNISAVVSYPSAMTEWRNYIEQINKQIEDVSNTTGLKLSGIESITESEAVARRIKAITPEATQFCSIDIGGGTSDIFLFKNDDNPLNLKWDGYESSLLCGARNILLDCFVKDKKLLMEILNVEEDDPIRKALLHTEERIEKWETESLSAEKVRANIEYLLGLDFEDPTHQKLNAGQELCARAVSEAGFQNSHVRTLRLALIFRIGAIMYYAGMMTRGTNAKLGNLYLQFAGNGSKTLNWISGNIDSSKKFLSAMFNAGAYMGKSQNDKQKPENIIFSKTHKHEVAEGALREAVPMASHIDEVITGEKVDLYDEGQKVIGSWQIEHNMEGELFKEAKHYIPGNETLKDFIKQLRDSAMTILKLPLEKNELDCSIADNSGVKLKVNTIIDEMVQGKMNDKRSFFMIGVDAVCDQLFKGEEL